MAQPQEQQEARLDALREQLVAQALDDVLHGAADNDSDRADLQPLRQAAQVTAALQQLELGPSTSTSAPPAAAAASATPDSDPAAEDAALFAGAPGGRLGVAAADLLAEVLPSEAARRQALAAAGPALEAELARRCRLVAAAAGYDATDFAGLPDHIRQLLAARSQGAQVDAWRKAAQQAQQAIDLLQHAAALLARLLERHVLTGQKEADEARAAALHCECGWLREKLRLVQLQLKEAAYKRPTVAALRAVAAEVEGALGEAGAKLQQASLQLRQYRALGPGFAEQAAEHRALLGALEETEYELREVEQFRQLAAATR